MKKKGPDALVTALIWIKMLLPPYLNAKALMF